MGLISARFKRDQTSREIKTHMRSIQNTPPIFLKRPAGEILTYIISRRKTFHSKTVSEMMAAEAVRYYALCSL